MLLDAHPRDRAENLAKSGETALRDGSIEQDQGSVTPTGNARRKVVGTGASRRGRGGSSSNGRSGPVFVPKSAQSRSQWARRCQWSEIRTGERNSHKQRRSADSIAMLGMRLDRSGEEVARASSAACCTGASSNDWDCPRERATGGTTEAVLLLSKKEELIRWPQHSAKVAAKKKKKYKHVYVQYESGLGSAKRATTEETSWQALALCGTLCAPAITAAADVERTSPFLRFDWSPPHWSTLSAGAAVGNEV